MDFRTVRARKSLWLAFIISLVLHAAVLCLGHAASDRNARPAVNPDEASAVLRPHLVATLARPPAVPVSAPSRPEPRRTAAPVSATSKHQEVPRRQAEPKKLSAATGVWANRSWSAAERADMDKFLNDLMLEAKPPTGQELSRKALAMARQMGRSAQDDGVDDKSLPATGRSREVEPYSLEMYFEAFLRKLNRSAAFVKRETGARGSRKALVEITLGADGALQGYRVLRSADQAAEIVYIKSVIERASPFSAFPPDIRKASDSLSIQMCIYPAHAGGGGGFSRSFGSQDCTD